MSEYGLNMNISYSLLSIMAKPELNISRGLASVHMLVEQISMNQGYSQV